MDNNTFKSLLGSRAKLQILLYRRAYLLTSRQNIDINSYPFFGNWIKADINDSFVLYLHREQHFYTRENGTVKTLLIGHAFNPFNGKYDENEILDELIGAYKVGKEEFFRSVSELTGIHMVCVFSPDESIFVQDCTAMKACYYGVCNGNVYLTSHLQIVRDIDTPQENPYIAKLMNSHSYRKLGSKYLPGDLTVLDSFSRLGPNVYLRYHHSEFSIARFYPEAAHPVCDENDENTIHMIADLIRNSVLLTSKKWNKPAISLSGGMDSRTTCAAASGNYEKFQFFSFYCKDAEKNDADAAHQICTELGIKHTIYPIPEPDCCTEEYDLYKEIIERNTAYVMPQPDHEIKKYIFLSRLNDFDVDIMSWASEIGRAFWERRVGVALPNKLSPRHFNIFQTRYLFNIDLMRKGDRAYADYLSRTGNSEPLYNYEHADCFCWEFRFGSWGTNVTTGQDIFNYEVTIPMNNRKLMDMFLWFPHDIRKKDEIHKRVILINEPRFADIGANVHNGYFGGKRLLLEKLYYFYRKAL